MNPKLAATYVVREVMGIFVMGVALFWSAGRINWWPAWAAIGVMLAWVVATAVNRFFSQTFRIQLERNHTVARSGPYRAMRHPAYAGAILYEMVIPILLTSWWALIPSGINALLLLFRTALEDRALYAELSGYKDYTRQVPYRLLPGVW